MLLQILEARPNCQVKILLDYVLDLQPWKFAVMNNQKQNMWTRTNLDLSVIVRKLTDMSTPNADSQQRCTKEFLPSPPVGVSWLPTKVICWQRFEKGSEEKKSNLVGLVIRRHAWTAGMDYPKWNCSARSGHGGVGVSRQRLQSLPRLAGLWLPLDLRKPGQPAGLQEPGEFRDSSKMSETRLGAW